MKMNKLVSIKNHILNFESIWPTILNALGLFILSSVRLLEETESELTHHNLFRICLNIVEL